MIVGVNAGYSHTKWVRGQDQGLFPSVVGAVSEEELGEVQGIIMEDGNGRAWFVGQAAIEQSLVVTRRESSNWVDSPEYRLLWHTAFSEMTRQFRGVELQVVTGLPIADFGRKRESLAGWLRQEHKVRRQGRQAQSFTVTEAAIFPELMGMAFALTIDGRGRQIENRVSTGHVIMVDVGGHTTNFLGLKAMRPMRPEARCISVGAFKVVTAVRAALDVQYPGLNYRDHEIIGAIKDRQVEWRGRSYNIGDIVDEASEPIIQSIMGVFSQLYNGASRHRMVILGGGGAHLASLLVRQAFPYPEYPEDFVYVFGDQGGHVDSSIEALAGGLDPVFGNAVGFYRYGLMKYG